MGTSTLSVIIPVLNEERTIASIIQIVLTWGRAWEVLVVNDEAGSDGTLAAIAQFRDQITILTSPRGRGKADAMILGVTKSRGELVMFLDGDLVGLTHKDLDALLAPVETGMVDMTIGARRASPANQAKFLPLQPLGGERVLWRRDILPIVSKMKGVGYGAEQVLNGAYKAKRVAYVQMPYVSVLLKFEKQAMGDAITRYLIEARDVTAQFARVYTESLSPPGKKMFHLIQKSLKRVLKYFE